MNDRTSRACAPPTKHGAAPQVLPQYDGRGVIGWMLLMDGSSADYTLHHVSAWSLNLYPGRNFSWTRDFENYFERGGQLPILVTEYGIDAMDTDEWYTTCVLSNVTSEEKRCLPSAGYASFANQGMQADWLLSLVEDLERHSTSCEQGCLSHTVSGGAVMAWVDETWKGRVIDAVSFNEVSASMSCPDTAEDIHSLCGYPSGGQPDSYVNEEWFGLHQVLGTLG